ncbi:hypothetical protein BUALT_Bualt03G0203900 [Buddleja alternifolia]|uniref:Transmembrane protein n=1 Tax=Buddleja alternifolia TaxID=168488 RepID=A0AAV6XW79_9LAMI|nr:hypothetical protein BUALT_Bualt03G0203900 [Buddleja alternifolia]
MGSRFLLAFFTLSALLLTIHARTHGSFSNPQLDPLKPRSRTLLLKSMADPPAEKEAAPSLSPEKADHDDEREGAAADAPTTESENRTMERHHSPDRSMAGGGVIIGGLVTAIFAAVYCYIRVTRKRPADSLMQ